MFMSTVCLYIPRLMPFLFHFPAVCVHGNSKPLHDAAPLPPKPTLQQEPLSHPLFHFPINAPLLLLTGVYSHSSWFAAGADRDRMLPICSWISAHTNPAAFPRPRSCPGLALPSCFPHGAAGGGEFPAQGDETLQCSHHSCQPFLPPAFPQLLTFPRQWAGIAARGSVSRIQMDVGIDPFVLSCLSLAVPREWHCPSTDLDSPPASNA